VLDMTKRAWLHKISAVFFAFDRCDTVDGFTPSLLLSSLQNSSERCTRLNVRNIDLPECLVFYGSESLRDDESGGLASLLQECKDMQTAVLLIDTGNDASSSSNNKNVADYQSFITQSYLYQVPPPNPHDLIHAIDTLTIQPRPFGGSAGFGSKLPDPSRAPMPSRCVVLATTLDQTRAARAAGMRVICWTDNALADAVVDVVDFGLDDIATPGSFWLNPPHPRDDDGNKVDPEQWNLITTSEKDGFVQSEEDIDEEELLRILSEIDPL
jgi:hypothetical protein